MLLGAATGWNAQSAKEWAERTVQQGCRAVIFPLDYTAKEEEIADYMAAAKENQLVIAEVGIWKNPLSPSSTEREKAKQYALGQLRLAEELGARCCVNISGTRSGTTWDGAYRDNFSEQTEQAIIDYIQELLDEVRPQKTAFTLEPMPWMLPSSPDEYLRLLQKTDREGFRVHLDIVNMINSPRRYLFADEFMEECFEKLGALTCSCHVKDILLLPELTSQLKEMPCGKGTLNLEKYFALAEKYDKDMPMIIEHLPSVKAYEESMEYMKQRLKNGGLL